MSDNFNIEEFIENLINSDHNCKEKVNKVLKDMGFVFKDRKLQLLPKFKYKRGDWIVYNGSIGKIINVDEKADGYDTTNGFLNREFLKTEGRLWNIEDAKRGDFLIDDKGLVICYYGIDKNKCFSKDGNAIIFSALFDMLSLSVVKNGLSIGVGTLTDNYLKPLEDENKKKLISSLIKKGYYINFTEIEQDTSLKSHLKNSLDLLTENQLLIIEDLINSWNNTEC